MSFDPQSFRSALAFDGARPNLFEVRLNFPDFVALEGDRAGSGDNAGGAEQFTFMCKSASIPAQTVASIPVAYQGRQIQVAGNRTFAPWSVTVINDEDFTLRNKFEIWNNALNGHRSNIRERRTAQNTNLYGSTAHVIQLSKEGSPLRSYKFIGMWPTDVAAIPLDWGSNDTLEQFDITFAYQWWETELGTSDGTGGEIPSRNVDIV